MMRKTTIAKRLDTAADILQERGLCKGRNEDERGRVCAEGAIALAIGGKSSIGFLDKRWSEFNAVTRELATGLALGQSVYIWSDASRDKRRVVSGLRRVAKQLRGEA